MQQDQYINLVYRQWQGRLSASEEQTLTNWLEACADHQRQAEEIRQSLEMLGDYEPGFDVDVRADYLKVKQQMNKEATAKKDTKILVLSSRRKWMGVAATIALLITASFLLWNQRSAPLEWMAIETKAGETHSITLEDGTQIWLNENSQLTYPRAFTKKNRPVEITGEAFFDVAKNTNQPFEITTAKSKVEVLGTSFNVRAYEVEPTTTVTVKSGHVRFSAKEEAVILIQNQEAVLHHESNQISHNKKADMNAMAWQTNYLRFRNHSLTEVFEIMERHFDIDIQNTNVALKDCKLTISREDNLENLFSKLIALFKIEVTRNGENVYVIKGGGCAD